MPTQSLSVPVIGGVAVLQLLHRVLRGILEACFRIQQFLTRPELQTSSTLLAISGQQRQQTNVEVHLLGG